MDTYPCFHEFFWTRALKIVDKVAYTNWKCVIKFIVINIYYQYHECVAALIPTLEFLPPEVKL